jgi:hypothetical protein
MEETMTVEEPDYAVSHPDRTFACEEAVEPELQRILADANTHGWGTMETISAMEEVLKHLRVAYAEDPDPAEDPPTDSGGANDFGEFPSAEGLVKAFVHGREKP